MLVERVEVRPGRLRHTNASQAAPDALDGPPSAKFSGKYGNYFRLWLGGRDSNPDSTVQSRVSYH